MLLRSHGADKWNLCERAALARSIAQNETESPYTNGPPTIHANAAPIRHSGGEVCTCTGPVPLPDTRAARPQAA